jgi:hypothetical protein
LQGQPDTKCEVKILQELLKTAIRLSYVRNLASSRLKGEKTMKRLFGAMALACVLSVPALAGDVPTAGLTSPTPGDVPTAGISSPATAGTTSPGELPTGGFAEQVSDAALSALLSVLGFVAA